eukprot:TRINITY_DN444_c0_g2_i3.p1 TRINITY_DN444_c0_g2~~TRINITY_DN444_c0_g2_i3.p1  ORF type:complete len:549 (+),score=78.61 TRINITY_DN444_c0_g2_i3:74-1648(+)
MVAEEPDVYNQHWGTQSCKIILSLVTMASVFIVWRVRTIEAAYNWKHHKPRSDSGVWLSGEIFLLSVHTPPFIDWALGLPGWWDTCNIFTFYRFYLLCEMLKINHPCWLRRGELVNVLRNSAGHAVAINTTYVVRVVLLQAPLQFWGSMFSFVLIIFTYWLYIMEQTATVYRPVWMWLYYTLTCFTGVGLGDVLVSTNLGRMITVMISMFGVAATAVFVSSLMNGVRMAENEIAAASVCDYLETTKRIKDHAATSIQRWWRNCIVEPRSETNLEMSIRPKLADQKRKWTKYPEWEDPLRNSANKIRLGFQKGCTKLLGRRSLLWSPKRSRKRPGRRKTISDMKLTQELESNAQQLTEKLEVLMSPSRSPSKNSKMGADEFIRGISRRHTSIGHNDKGAQENIATSTSIISVNRIQLRIEQRINTIDKNLKCLKIMLIQLCGGKAADQNNQKQIIWDEMERRLSTLSNSRPISPQQKLLAQLHSGTSEATSPLRQKQCQEEEQGKRVQKSGPDGGEELAGKKKQP